MPTTILLVISSLLIGFGLSLGASGVVSVGSLGEGAFLTGLTLVGLLAARAIWTMANR